LLQSYKNITNSTIKHFVRTPSIQKLKIKLKLNPFDGNYSNWRRKFRAVLLLRKLSYLPINKLLNIYAHVQALTPSKNRTTERLDIFFSYLKSIKFTNDIKDLWLLLNLKKLFRYKTGTARRLKYLKKKQISCHLYKGVWVL